MDTQLKSKITTILKNANLNDQYSEMLANLDLSPLVSILDAVEKEDGAKLAESLSSYSRCSVEHQLREEQYDRLGHLARQFQKSLINFRDSLGPRLSEMADGPGDVQNQIESVIKMTNNSAMTVLSLAERQSSTFQVFKEEAEKIGKSLIANTQDEQMKASFSSLSSKMQEINSDLEESNKHLLLSQTYQDLTGQILQKIKLFIDSVENGLMEIVRMLTEEDIDQKLAEIDTERLKHHCSQDDVDDLLSSLGF